MKKLALLFAGLSLFVATGCSDDNDNNPDDDGDDVRALHPFRHMQVLIWFRWGVVGSAHGLRSRLVMRR